MSLRCVSSLVTSHLKDASTMQAIAITHHLVSPSNEDDKDVTPLPLLHPHPHPQHNLNEDNTTVTTSQQHNHHHLTTTRSYHPNPPCPSSHMQQQQQQHSTQMVSAVTVVVALYTTNCIVWNKVDVCPTDRIVFHVAHDEKMFCMRQSSYPSCIFKMYMCEIHENQ